MNFIQMISSIAVMTSLMISANCGLRLCEKSEQKILARKKQIQCEKFIVESFKKTSDGQGFESFNQWQKVCRAMWNLDYIGWSNASDFMIIPDDCNYEIYYGIWKSGENSGEIYSRQLKK